MSASPHLRLVGKLSAVALAMFAFGVFAMPPLYQKFCEITGIGQDGVRIAAAAPTAPVSGRTVRVRFDATTNSALNWDFQPVDGYLQVSLGQATTAQYTAANLDPTPSAGRAVYNVSPPEASRYFVKTHCFCFERQELAAGERREMPVYFYIADDLPEDIEELTLAYTFFKMDEA